MAAVVACSALPASAALITINGITPAWVNPSPAGVTINNAGDPITARWGVPAGGTGQSGYNFNDSTTPVTIDTNVNSGRFLLGTFTHLNQPIYEPWLASIGLSITVDILGGVPGSFTEIFTLFHNETPNDCGCVPNDNDIVTFSAGTLNSSFTVGGQSYILSLLGFSNNGGNTLVSSFSSVEGGNNSTQLWARIAARPTAVPEPGTLLLIGAGLLSLAFVRRRKLI
jgi:hypothetical protein